MKLITSSENQIYKSAMLLKQKKYRDAQKKYVIEGPNLIQEALKNGAEIEALIQSEEFCFKSDSIPMTRFSSALFRKLSETETPQGILAIVKKSIYTADQFFSEKKERSGNFVVLDRLQDPGNIGTILRTADAAGYGGVILLKGTADIYSAKVVRAAAGSLFRVPVLWIDTPEEAIGILRDWGKKIYVTVPSADSYYYHTDMRDHIGLVIGNEGSGACDVLIQSADKKIKIPMEGTIESLNAAVAASILMYESVRQKYANNITR